MGVDVSTISPTNSVWLESAFVSTLCASSGVVATLTTWAVSARRIELNCHIFAYSGFVLVHFGLKPMPVLISAFGSLCCIFLVKGTYNINKINDLTSKPKPVYI